MSDHRHFLLATLSIGFTFWTSTAGCDPVKPPPQPKQISLSSVVTTSGQKKMVRAFPQPIEDDGNRNLRAAFEELFDPSKIAGSSNVFLVDAPTFSDAITATIKIVARGYTADSPLLLDQPDPTRVNHWLVVYLGVAGSEPVRWIIDSVFIESGIVRFNYHEDPIGGQTRDVNQYYYWVPLGKLDDGVYKLELYDGGLKDVTLSRRVEIKSPPVPKRARK
jgi:hypothetical protein